MFSLDRDQFELLMNRVVTGVCLLAILILIGLAPSPLNFLHVVLLAPFILWEGVHSLTDLVWILSAINSAGAMMFLVAGINFLCWVLQEKRALKTPVCLPPTEWTLLLWVYIGMSGVKLVSVPDLYGTDFFIGTLFVIALVGAGATLFLCNTNTVNMFYGGLVHHNKYEKD